MTSFPYKAVILDFDGVLVESNAIKTSAFEHVFAAYPEHLPVILEYHHRHAVIRFKKFRYIYEQVLKRSYTVQDEAALAKSFSDFCVDAVIKCPEVKGARAFLEYFYDRLPLYLVSINPSEDLTLSLEGRSLSGFFKKVYAVEDSKTPAIRDILRRENLNTPQVVFIGDSAGDTESAKEAGIDYIDRNRFQDMGQISAYLQSNFILNGVKGS